MKETAKFSVLMSLYKGETPEYFAQAVESLIYQTLPPSEIVIVKDGPLTKPLNDALLSYTTKYPNLIKTLTLPQNRGLGRALSLGLSLCTHEIVARMDTNDICRRRRFERQISFMQERKDIDILGANICEFEDDPSQPSCIREMPKTQEEIEQFSKSRNPFNHMTVVFRKSAVLECGSYEHFLWFEDYHLWMRMLASGKKAANLNEVLVDVRAGRELHQRRGGFEYLKNECRLHWHFFSEGFLNSKQLAFNIVSRILFRLAPNEVRGRLYSLFTRKRARPPLNRI